MRFGVLGPLAVWTREGRPVAVPETKVRALLAHLLVEPGRAVPAERLARDLWGERQPRDPANSLQTKVSQLRRTLEAAEPGGRALVVHQPPGYLLRVGPDAVDAQRFRALTARAMATTDPATRAELLTAATGLWRGPVLADFADEPFAVAVAHRLDEERLVALEEWVQARLDLGEHAQVLGELGDLVARHPLRERLLGLHMRALYRSGRQSDALAGYAALRRRLADELGLDPSPELVELHRAVLGQALDEPPAPPPTPRLPPHTNLPAALVDLVGRETAVEAVCARTAESRLVTLTGPGGVGKTSLALAAARAVAARGDGQGFVDGVWFVEFSGLEPSAVADHRVVTVIAAALGVREEPGQAGDPVDRLAAALAGRRILLVLDNCEQVVGPVARVVARLLRRAPRAAVLATSREPLGVQGEVLWTVPPLEVPGAAALQGATDDVLARFSAVRLFVARAAAAAPGFALDAGNARAVATICSRLDGIPLALELAATKVRALGVHELLRRLDDRFRLLGPGRRDAPARQRTLRAMIDWSWELLLPAERAVLRRLAVHAEGCGLDAAEALCAGPDVAPGEVLDVLVGLVDRSLVVSAPGPTGEPRYRLLESVAAYCLERLAEAGEVEQLRVRHSEHYLELAQQAGPGLRGADQRRRLELLDAETPNLRAALDVAIAAGSAATALRLVHALGWYWFLRGRLGEASRAFAAALAVPGPDLDAQRAAAAAWRAGFEVLAGAPGAGAIDDATIAATVGIADPDARDGALWFLGYILTTLGDMTRARRLTALALARFRARGDRWGTAAASTDSASQALAGGEIAAARAAAERGAELFTELGDRWGQLQATFALGSLAEIAGDYATAARLFGSGVRRAEELGLWPEVSYQLSWLGRVALLRGELGRSRELHERALRLAVERGFKPGEVFAETGLALVARRDGRLDDAERHLGRVLAWHRRAGFEAGSTLVLAELGFVAEQRGDAATAATLHREGLALAQRVGDPRAVALALEGLAGASVVAGDAAGAARQLGAAARARESVHSPLPPGERGDVDRITAAAVAALGADAFSAEFAIGGARADHVNGEPNKDQETNAPELALPVGLEPAT